MEVFKEFSFDAAHRLAHAPEGHKCRRLHGHTYRVAVHITGPVDPHIGWVIDFADIKAAMRPIIDRLDHHDLNDINDMGQPTAENIARWIWRRLAPSLPGLSKLIVYESDTSGCVYAGELE